LPHGPRIKCNSLLEDEILLCVLYGRLPTASVVQHATKNKAIRCCALVIAADRLTASVSPVHRACAKARIKLAIVTYFTVTLPPDPLAGSTVNPLILTGANSHKAAG